MSTNTGSFTIPGEAGYEGLTLELARRWGADMIRDSDGTALSPEITNAGYGIYSTICIIRDHNAWAKQNPDKLQQTFLISKPVVAESCTIQIDLLDGYFREQFAVNESESSLRYWQVHDRTSGDEVPREKWHYENGTVVIEGIIPWRRYSVNFLAYRVWEEISMYNHTTNHWDKEHLMQIDPIYPETRQYMLRWLEEWCEEHPDTTVVRFTSLFYNFAWIWGDDSRNRSLFTDWGSYDFTVSPAALDLFSKRYGYALTAEDFINGGNRHVTHMPPTQKQLDWMDFVNEFVTGFGRELVDIVHRYGKQAYVFYDDSWIGLEPYSTRFPDFEFDGLIKCVFSGFEARLCAGVSSVQTKEIRLHPYLFPVGLGGAPTFMEGGNPTLDAKQYWVNVRRALLRQPVDRIGLGGYLHLVEDFPDFCEYIADIADEFREIKTLHEQGAPETLAPKLGILTAWGKLRSWTCSGHYHENPNNDLINLIESLSGLPFDVRFLSFQDVNEDTLNQLDAVINAGEPGSAWSGGDFWKDSAVVECFTQWVHRGGVFFGVNAPSAVDGYDTYLRMAHILGVDIDTGKRVNHGKWRYEVDTPDWLPQNISISSRKNAYLMDSVVQVLYAEATEPCLTVNSFGNGKGIYLSSYRHTMANARMIKRLILHATCHKDDYEISNEQVDSTYFRQSGVLVLTNASSQSIDVEFMNTQYRLDPYGYYSMPL